MDRTLDVVARRLFEAGCRHAFGMPGGEVLTLVDALEKSGIEFVLCKHENSAGFMAEGTCHVSGAPGILVTTIGPGLANGINVIANAEQDRVPLVVLTGCVDADEALTYTHQIFDHQALLSPLVKSSWRLTPGGADLIADRAVMLALADRPGPVHIDIPISVADMTVESVTSVRRVAPAPVAPADGTTLDACAAALQRAQRPIVIAGLEVLTHQACAALRQFVEHLSAPLVTTYKAKGVLSEDHRLCLGGAGLSPAADQHLLALVREADAVVLAGYDPIEMRTGWRNPWDPESQSVIELSAVPNDHYMHHATHSFVCDIGAGLEKLAQRLTPKTGWPDDAPTATHSALRAQFSSTGGWTVETIIETCRRELPAETIATVDSGAHRILLSQMWSCYTPRTLLQSTGLCTMGCALPLALGVKLTSPATPVVAFTGDAGLLMVLGELSTAVEQQLGITVVVFVDASLALIEMKQRARLFGNAGVDFGRFDFAGLARAFGGDGYSVDNVDALIDALRKVGQSETFQLIACQIDRQAYDGRF